SQLSSRPRHDPKGAHRSRAPMRESLHHPTEFTSNSARDLVAQFEPRSLRTYTPTQAVLARSAGIYHWTPEGRRLYDFTSGVLAASLRPTPTAWMKRFAASMDWEQWAEKNDTSPAPPAHYFSALPMTAYNAVTPIEVEASRRLTALLQNRSGGKRLEQVMW